MGYPFIQFIHLCSWDTHLYIWDKLENDESLATFTRLFYFITYTIYLSISFIALSVSVSLPLSPTQTCIHYLVSNIVVILPLFIQVGPSYFSEVLSQLQWRKAQSQIQQQGHSNPTSAGLVQNHVPVRAPVQPGFCQEGQGNQLSVPGFMGTTEAGHFDRPLPGLVTPDMTSYSEYLTPSQVGAISGYSQSDCDNTLQKHSFIGCQSARGEDSFPSLIQQRLAMSSFTHQPIGEQLQQLVVGLQPCLPTRDSIQDPLPANGTNVYLSHSQTAPSHMMKFGQVDSQTPSHGSSRISPFVDSVDVDPSNNSRSALSSSIYGHSQTFRENIENRERRSTPLASLYSSSDLPQAVQPKTLSSSVWLTQPSSPTPSFSYLDPSTIMSYELDKVSPEQSQDFCWRTHQDSMVHSEGQLRTDLSFTTYQATATQDQGLIAQRSIQIEPWAKLSSSSESSSQLPGILEPNTEADSSMSVEHYQPRSKKMSTLLSTRTSGSEDIAQIRESQELTSEGQKVVAHGPSQRRAGVFMAVHPFQNQNKFPFVSSTSPTQTPQPVLTNSTVSSFAQPSSLPFTGIDSDVPESQLFVTYPAQQAITSDFSVHSFPDPDVPSEHLGVQGARPTSLGFSLSGSGLEVTDQAMDTPVLQLEEGVSHFGQTVVDMGQQSGVDFWEQGEEQMDMS